MQQTNETKSNVHVKVEYNKEFRRFVVETMSFEHLERTLRTLLNIEPTMAVTILFLDDEKDWVLLSSDDELSYAWELSGSLLRLSVKSKTDLPAPAPVSEQTPNLVPVRVPFAPGDWQDRPRRGGCRGGRAGGHGRGKGRDESWFLARQEMFDVKLERLSAKHEMLSAKLASGELTEDKARAISWRVSHLQNKIDGMKWKKENFSQKSDAATTPAPQEEQAPAAPTCEKTTWGGGCRGRRGGRGGGCRGRESYEENPLFATLLEKKIALRAAREAGNREDIQEKWEALQEAKTNWREAKRAAFAQCPRKQAK